MGQSLLFSSHSWRVGRESMAMAPPPVHDSAVSPYFHGCLAFLHRHFPPQSPPLHPLDLSLCSQQQSLPWDCFTVPKLQLWATAPSRGSVSLSRVCMAVARTVWFSFHLGCHRSAVSFSALNVPPLTQTIALIWGLDPCFSSPPAESRSSPTNTPVFPPVPSSYRVLLGSYRVLLGSIHFPTVQGLLSVLSWCSSCPSVSEGVFLMYSWREMYSTFTYSSAILFQWSDL